MPTSTVLRAARLLLGVSSFSDPQTAVLATALTLGRLCQRHYPDALERVLGVVRESFNAAA